MEPSMVSTHWIPAKAYFTLKEACELKNLHYKTACNRTHLQPNRGITEARIGGRKAFTRETVLAWLEMDDVTLEAGAVYQASGTSNSCDMGSGGNV
jgi:hypothetical protein